MPSRCLIYVLIASIVWLAITIALYPGLMAPDSLFQYAQAKSGQISNWHPPIMVYLWQLIDPLIAGPSGMYLLAMILYGVGAISLSFQLANRLWSRLSFFTLLIFPAPLAILITVWKDALLIASLMAALSLLVWIRTRYHPLKLLSGLLLLTLATLLRHNAILALLPLIWLFLSARRKSCQEPAKADDPMYRSQRERKFVGENLWCRSAYVTVIAGIMLQLSAIADAPTHKVSPLPMVAAWDLAAISLEINEVVIPSYALHQSVTTLPELQSLFSSTSNVPLCRLQDGVRKVYCVEALPLRFGEGLPSDKVDDFVLHWLDSMLQHPVTYLKHRANLMLYLFDIKSEDSAIGINIGHLQPTALEGDWYDGPSATELGIASFANPSTAGQAVIDGLVWLRLHTVLLSPWMYGLVWVGVILFGWKRHNGVSKGLLLSAFFMAAPLFIIAPNYQLRYLIWPILATIITAWLTATAKRSA